MKNKENILFDFVKKNFSKNTITLKSLKRLKDNDISTECFLNFLNKKYNYFFHGSTTFIRVGENIKGDEKIFLTNESSIAILKALFSNRNAILCYPYFINKKHPLELVIEKRKGYLKKKTIAKKGYIYVISSSIKTKNEPKKSWQYVIEKNTRIGIPFIKKIKTERKDFLYPIKIKTRKGGFA